MSGWSDHLAIAPIIVPLLAGTAMILMGEHRNAQKAALGVGSTLVLLVLALVLLRATHLQGAGSTVLSYRLGDWPALFGIVLVLDRLAALMLLLTSLIGLAALLFSLARWHRVGVNFPAIFQFQLAGLNGAFLTGDLFNLFVFFEVMLAASYGLVLHGPQTVRVRAGLHYLVINLTASLLFLIGVSMIYGIVGTLNMAELASRISTVAAEDRALLEVGAAILGIAFLIKAAIWPVGFWLPTTYAAASAPSAALLSLLSKVGIYAVLRLWLMMFGESAGESAGFGSSWLLFGGLMTVVFGSIAILATQNMARLAGASVLVSSGTLLAAIATGQVAVTGGALFYLASSVLGIAALFLLIELVERGRGVGADVIAVTREAFGEEEEDAEEPAGIAIPATTAILGASFLVCALILAGFPPLSGFLAKLAMLVPLFGSDISPGAWTILTVLLLSGLATMIAMTRTGIDVFWASPAETIPTVRLSEIGPVLLLLALSMALTVRPAPVMAFMEATAQSLHAPRDYLRGVLPPPRAVPPAESGER